MTVVAPNLCSKICRLTIAATQVLENGTYAVLFDGSGESYKFGTRLPDDLFSSCQNDGGDICFATNFDGTGRLNVDVVGVNIAAKTAEIWVSVPLTTSADKTIYMFYQSNSGTLTQPAPTALYGSRAVWSSVSSGSVYHFGNYGQTNVAVDAMGVASGTGYNMDPSHVGLFGGAAGGSASFLPGVYGSYIDLGTGLGKPSNFDISFWMQPISVSVGYNSFIYQISAGGDPNSAWGFWQNGLSGPSGVTGFFYFDVSNGTAQQDWIIQFNYSTASTYPGFTGVLEGQPNSPYNYVNVRITGNGTTLKYYINGNLLYTRPQTVQNTGVVHKTFLNQRGEAGGGRSWFNMDELRFSSTIPSANRIKTDYNIQTSSSLVTVVAIYTKISSAGSAVGAASVSGIGRGKWQTTGNVVGVATASATSSPPAKGIANSFAAATGRGARITAVRANSVASAAGSATASGATRAKRVGTGTANGVATTSIKSFPPSRMVLTNGTSAASGYGTTKSSVFKNSVATSQGVAIATANANAGSIGTVLASATVSGIASNPRTATAFGTSSALFRSSLVLPVYQTTTGYANGNSFTNIVGRSGSVGTAAGSATALARFSFASTGTANSTSTANAVGYLAGKFVSNGVSYVQGRSLTGSTGTANGSATANAVNNSYATSTATANGVATVSIVSMPAGTATANGTSTASSTCGISSSGTIVASSTASGVGAVFVPTFKTSVATAAGTSTATFKYFPPSVFTSAATSLAKASGKSISVVRFNCKFTSAGVSLAKGVGRSLSSIKYNSVAKATASSTALAVGRKAAPAAATALGVSSTNIISAGIATVTSNANSAANAVGATLVSFTFDSVFTANAFNTALAIGVNPSIATAYGEATAYGDNSTLSIATASGDSFTNMLSGGISDATSNGDSTADGVGYPTSDALANGDSTASGVGFVAFTGSAIGISNGDSSANGVGFIVYNVSGIGTSNGDSTADAVGPSIASAGGDSTANGDLVAIISLVGVANGDSNASAVGYPASDGTANGLSIAGAVSNVYVGTAIGFATADATGDILPVTNFNSVGTANGDSSANAVALIQFVYYPDGNIVTTGGTADTKYVFYFGITFQWQVLSKVELDISFSWNVGTLPLRYYRVQGSCNYPTSAGSGTTPNIPGGCNVMGIQTDDAKCLGAIGRQQFIQTILARSVVDVCKQLQASRLNWRVTSIKQWSRPADGRLVSPTDTCNTLTEVPFADVPECFNSIASNNYVVDMGITTITIEYIQNYVGSGEAKLYGSADVSSSLGDPTVAIYEYNPDGNEILTGGSAIATSSWDNNVLSIMGVSSVVENLEFILGTSAISDLIIPARTAATSCANCTAIPYLFYLHHNIVNKGIFFDFLQRNGFSFPSAIPMNYNPIFTSWSGNQHFAGVGGDNYNDESWRFTFEWTCTSQIAGENLGTSYWKLSILVVRKTAVKDYDTRILIVFPPEDLCAAIQNLRIDFSFNINTSTYFLSDTLGITANTILFNDNIGLFKSSYWTANYSFTIKLSSSESEIVVPTQDISQILPPVSPLTVTSNTVTG